MNMQRPIWLLLFSVACFYLQALSPEDEEFIKKYSAPPFMVDALAGQTNFLKKINKCVLEYGHMYCKRWQRHLVWKFPSLPGYYVKWDISRIRGMERMRACMKEHNLNALAVPNKYLYHIPGRGRELTNGNYFVIAESQRPVHKNIKINGEEAQQICTLIKETGYYDFAKQNICRLKKSNKIVFIDIEKFIGQDTSGWLSKDFFYMAFAQMFIMSKFNLKNNFTKGGLEVFLSHLLEFRPHDKKRYKKMYWAITKYLRKKYGRSGPHKLLGLFKKTFPKPT